MSKDIQEAIEMLAYIKEHNSLIGFENQERQGMAETVLNCIEALEKENKDLKQTVELGLNKEKQYCFYNKDSSDKCMGYSNYNDDEPCDYCKSCERLSTKEDD